MRDAKMTTWSIGICLLLGSNAFAQSDQIGEQNRTREQIPDMSSLEDSSALLQAEIDRQNGNLNLNHRFTRITKTLEFDLRKHGAVLIQASVGATLIMDGPGPAIRITGSHEGTASPKSFKPTTWNERMPIVRGIEIVGAHRLSDGIELRRTVEASVESVAVRWCRHGIHLVDRNRNVVVSNCHLYENSGVGVFLDDVNLHQINVSNSHISYNRAGGIVVRDGNVRNLQVSGSDIEGNMPADDTATKTANILIDVSGSPADKTKSIAEIAITGCTIQHAANYSGDEDKTLAPGGANIRLAGKSIYPIDSVTISGNVLSDTSSNVDIAYSNDVVISANTFFAPKPNNLVVQHSKRVVVTGNSFNPRQFERPGTIRFSDCEDCLLGTSSIHRFTATKGAVVLERCNGFVLNALMMTDCASGIVIRDSSEILVSGCSIRRTKEGQGISVDPSNTSISLIGNVMDGDRTTDSRSSK